MAGRFAYFDTSVIVKRYFKEPGSDRARQLMRQYHVLTSDIVGVESISAFRRRLVAGDLDETVYAAITRQFKQNREQIRCMQVSLSILDKAEIYVVDHNIRTLDAIHLASATIDPQSSKELPFITADANQRAAASALGLQVIWVQ